MITSKKYDFIICGAGCAGLSLAYRLCSSEFSHLHILLIDREPKTLNDRTWCSWQLKDHFYFSDIHYKRWHHLSFKSPTVQKDLSLDRYVYCMIRGIDFYEYCLKKIALYPNIEIRYEDIESVRSTDHFAVVHTKENNYEAQRVFDSTVKQFPDDHELFVWQHFKGWMIETEEDCFEAEKACLMDFRIEQQDDTRFMYVLPFSTNRAFIEATIYNKSIPDPAYYDPILKDYLSDFLGISSYKITEEEVGAIPMTTAKFSAFNSRHIPIGTNASTVKPSSGYAFVRIQEESEQIIEQIRSNRYVAIRKKKRFLAYDRTLLHVVISKKETLAHVFSLLFDRNRIEAILKFLDEKTSLIEEVRIFATLPIWSFTSSFTSQNVLKITKTE